MIMSAPPPPLKNKIIVRNTNQQLRYCCVSYVSRLRPGWTGARPRVVPLAEASDGDVAGGGHVEYLLRPPDPLFAGVRQVPFLFSFWFWFLCYEFCFVLFCFILFCCFGHVWFGMFDISKQHRGPVSSFCLA